MSGQDPQSNNPLPRAPSGRTPQWVHDEEVRRLVRAMHGEQSAAPKRGGWFNNGRPKRIRRKRRNPVRVLLTLCMVLALMGISAWYLSPELAAKISTSIAGEQFHAPGSAAGLIDSGKWSSGFPPWGIEAQRKPLGGPVQLSQTNDSYAFQHENGVLVAYDPCRPIHYATRPDNAPPGGQELIADAVAAASKATGLVFIDDGATSEAFSGDRSAYQPDRYGKRWAPVLIVWETPQEEPRFAAGGEPGVENLAGLGGSQPIVGDAGSLVLVTGTVQLSLLAFQDVLTRPNGTAIARGIIEHELGHVLGLGHVQDPSQLMYEHGQNEVATFAAGDLTGLAQLGQGKCFPNH